MTFGVRPPGPLSRVDAIIAPTAALCFSLLIAWIEPHYTQWYGDAMPTLTRAFIARHQTYIEITAGGVTMQVIGMMFGLRGVAGTLWKILDTVLAIASTLIIVVGLIALALPLFLLQLPV